MNEIEEFLKRAAALRAQQAGQRAGQAGHPPAASPSPRPLAPGWTQADVVPAQVVDPKVMDAEILDPGTFAASSASETAGRSLGTLGGDGPAAGSRFASPVSQADDVMEAHLQQVFEHRLGSLGARTGRPEESTLDSEEAAAKAARTAPASPWGILRMLRSPQEMRNAIILSELLNPPVHRW